MYPVSSVVGKEIYRITIRPNQVRELRNAQIVGKSSENDDVDAKDIVKKRKVFVDAANEYEDTGNADEDDEVVEKVEM